MPSRCTRIAHLVALCVFSAALFAPMMGRGFVLDDFGHAFVAAHESVWFGLTKASGGPYYAPVAWLTYKVSWILWGANPFAWAAGNLVIHIVNTLLLYFLALQLWRSDRAAWWAAFGFALLFPANVSAIMFISTRAHLIVTLFYIATIIAALWFTRTERLQTLAASAVVAFAALSMFAKESGVTVIMAVAIVIVYERMSQGRKLISLDLIALIAALLAILALYLGLRAQSGAVSINFSGDTSDTIGYTLSPAVWCENFILYCLRTYGLLSIVAVAVAVSLRIRDVRPRLDSLTKYDVLFSIGLFAVSIAPFVLMSQRPGQYSYLPGIGAALLLGAVARSLYEHAPDAQRQALNFVSLAPIILVVALYTAFTVVSSLRWIQMAETNASVLSQIATQQPSVESDAFIVLTYPEIDRANRFPAGFSGWCFPWALRVLYLDRTVDGKIVRQGDQYSIGDKSYEVHFSYVSGDTPKVIKTGESLPGT